MRFRLVIVLVVVVLLTGLAAGCGDLGSNGQRSSATSSTTGLTQPAASESTTLSPAETILGRMTIEQKAAQVLLVAFEGTTPTPETERLLADGPPGGFLLLGRNVYRADQLRSLTAALQLDASTEGARVGLFIAVDQEGGTVQPVQIGVPSVPSARSLAEQSNTQEAAKLAAATATGLLALGVNMNLAPVADIVSDPNSFLYARAYGGDPTIVGRFVRAVTTSYEDNGLIAVVRHFPGHGSASSDGHSGAVVSSTPEAEFATLHLPPFKVAFAAGAEGVLMAHIIATAYDPEWPASSSAAVIEGVLRKGLGFSGLVVADDVEMLGAQATGDVDGRQTTTTAGPGAQVTDPGDVAVRELAAGCDLVICTGAVDRQRAIIEAIVKAVDAGRLTRERLDDAVLRILETKVRHGLISP